MSELRNWQWLTPGEISIQTGISLDVVCDSLPRLVAEGKAQASTIGSRGVSLPVFRSTACLWA